MATMKLKSVLYVFCFNNEKYGTCESLGAGGHVVLKKKVGRRTESDMKVEDCLRFTLESVQIEGI